MLNNIRIFNKRENLLVAYKLLVDSLFILFVVFISSMLAEGALPGIISGHIGLYKIALLIAADVLAISIIIKQAEIPERTVINKKIAWPLFFILGLLIFNSMLQLNIFLAVFLLAAIFVMTFYLLKVFQE